MYNSQLLMLYNTDSNNNIASPSSIAPSPISFWAVIIGLDHCMLLGSFDKQLTHFTTLSHSCPQ